MSVGAGTALQRSRPVTTLRCVGTLDRQTRHHLVTVVEQMLRRDPATVTVDVGALELADGEAGSALAEVERMVKDAGAEMHWHGVRADHLRKSPTLRPRLGARSAE
jgi:ABC-type transporter Mla MlaB component